MLPLVVVLAACGATGPAPGTDGGVDGGLPDGGALGCGQASCPGCCAGGACLAPSLQDDSACGLQGRQCVTCALGTETCFAGICTSPEATMARDAGSPFFCYLERPTTSCDDQGGPAAGLSGDKGRCELTADGGRECRCAYQKNPLTGLCLGTPSGPGLDGGFCALEFQGCSVRGDCCNGRHSCFPDGCHY